MRRGWVWMLLSLHAALPPGRSEKSSLQFWVRNSHWDENFQRILKREAAMSKKKKCREWLEKKTCPMEVNNKVLTTLIKARKTWMKLPSNPTHWLRESIWSYSLSSKRVKPNLDGKSVFNNTKKPNIKLKSCPKQKMITQVKRWLRRGAASREEKWYCQFIYWK